MKIQWAICLRHDSMFIIMLYFGICCTIRFSLIVRVHTIWFSIRGLPSDTLFEVENQDLLSFKEENENIFVFNSSNEICWNSETNWRQPCTTCYVYTEYTLYSMFNADVQLSWHRWKVRLLLGMSKEAKIKIQWFIAMVHYFW